MKKLSVWLAFIFFAIPLISQAATNFSLAPACSATGYCSVCDVVSLAVQYEKIILGLLSAGVLLMFVLGGFYLITSSGNQERVTKGKKILIASITGVLIVAFAWVGVNTLIGVLMNKNLTEINKDSVKLSSGTLWWQFPVCSAGKVADCSSPTTTVGTLCSSCESSGSGNTGDTPCSCQIPAASSSDWQTLELKGNCGKDGKAPSLCKCMTACDKIARDVPSLYGSYKCINSYNNATQNLECKPGNWCAYSEKGTADPQQFQCCGPATP